VAPLKDRIKHVMEQESLDERAARRRIDEVESQRAEFLIQHFGHRPYDPRRYDMVLNAGCLSIDDMCSLVRLAAERKLGSPLECTKVLA
jgi:cytidylate kinase